VTVKVGECVLPYIERGLDTDSYSAEKIALKLATRSFLDFSHASVHRFDGLVVYSPSGKFGWHFSTALCGYRGSGTKASANILTMFGFGNYDYMLATLERGGERAFYKFIKDVGLVDSKH
jgi:hypothetical protein